MCSVYHAAAFFRVHEKKVIAILKTVGVICSTRMSFDLFLRVQSAPVCSRGVHAGRALPGFCQHYIQVSLMCVTTSTASCDTALRLLETPAFSHWLLAVKRNNLAGPSSRWMAVCGSRWAERCSGPAVIVQDALKTNKY